jgi:hypothetical protein
VNGFGKLFARFVAGQIYAQPLILTGVNIPNTGVRAVVYVATSQDNVYAFDAQDPEACHPFWMRSLGTPVPRSDYGGDYFDFSNEIGIISTPVIDPVSRTLYLTAKSKSGAAAGAHYFYHLHALDIATGQPKAGSPKLIAESTTGAAISGPSAAGTARDGNGGRVVLNAFHHLQRPGLLLLDGVLFLAFASHGDKPQYHGWVVAYDANSLDLIASYCTSPDSEQSGIWQSGCGIAADRADEVYVVTGNGPTGNKNFASGPFFGCSIIRLTLDRVAKKFDIADWFTPSNVSTLNVADDDLCGGPVLVPGKNIVVGFGKDGRFYVLDRAAMGHWNGGGNHIIQDDQFCNGNIHGPAAYYQSANALTSFVMSEEDFLKAHEFQNGKFQLSSQSLERAPHGMPGGMVTVSANGVQPQSAIVWVSHPLDSDANHRTVAGVLRAYAATNLKTQLWRSNHDPDGTDDYGNFAKFCPPIVANGRVYMGTFSNQLVVYGLLTEPHLPPASGWSQKNIGTPVEGSASFSCDRFTIMGAGVDIETTRDEFHFVYQQISAPNVILTARIDAVQNTNEWAKAGLMIRQSLNDNSPHAYIAVTPMHGTVFQTRGVAGGPTVDLPAGGQAAVHPFGAPVWLRIKRNPTDGAFSLSVFTSSDGKNWTAFGLPVVLNLAAPVFVGMAVTSHTSDQIPAVGVAVPLQELCMALFDHVQLETNP